MWNVSHIVAELILLLKWSTETFFLSHDSSLAPLFLVYLCCETRSLYILGSSTVWEANDTFPSLSISTLHKNSRERERKEASDWIDVVLFQLLRNPTRAHGSSYSCWWSSWFNTMLLESTPTWLPDFLLARSWLPKKATLEQQRESLIAENSWLFDYRSSLSRDLASWRDLPRQISTAPGEVARGKQFRQIQFWPWLLFFLQRSTRQRSCATFSWLSHTPNIQTKNIYNRVPICTDGAKTRSGCRYVSEPYQ